MRSGATILRRRCAMLHRFAAASVVAAVVIAAGALASLLAGFPREGARVLTTAWCLVPLAWGLWAMLAPKSWVPGRLALWGGVLGLVAGAMAGLVLNLPLRLFALSGVGWLPVVVGPVFYYLLWMAVRAIYRKLRTGGALAAASRD